MVMAVYQPGNVEISTTISIGVIGVMVMVILFYLWLCVVSLYQSLKEIQNLGSDQARIVVIAMNDFYEISTRSAKIGNHGIRVFR